MLSVIPSCSWFHFFAAMDFKFCLFLFRDAFKYNLEWFITHYLLPWTLQRTRVDSLPSRRLNFWFCAMQQNQSLEFFLNDFLLFQGIQWIMTKFNTSMVTKDILHLTIVTFHDVVVKKNFPLLSVDWYLFRVVSGNRYLPKGSNESASYITSTGNVSLSR